MNILKYSGENIYQSGPESIKIKMLIDYMNYGFLNSLHFSRGYIRFLMESGLKKHLNQNPTQIITLINFLIVESRNNSLPFIHLSPPLI